MKINYKLLPRLSIILFFIILFFGGIFSELGLVSNPPNWAPNLFMLFGSLIILMYSKKKLIYTLLFIGILGFIYEVVGAKYGFLFGGYEYSNVFNIQLFSVPLVMISAWIIVVTFTLSIIQDFDKKYAPILGAIIMVILDLVIDPIAVHVLKIWVWEDSGFYYNIPLHNFLGWFFLSIPIIYIMNFIDYRIDNISRIISVSIIGFFSIIGLMNNIYLASGIGLIIILINIFFYQKQKKVGDV
ncbi:MAG: carotenoid biosynthesis protein [Dehalococcoidales bacterium]|nr:carotenoid biosynthesis protein [Dehalococcoidales bacterium]